MLQFKGHCLLSSRVSVIMVAVISAIHYLAETILIAYVRDDGLMEDFTWNQPEFTTMVSFQVIMMAVSLTLFLGVVWEMTWLALPWITVHCIHLLYSLHVFIVLMMTMAKELTWVSCEVAGIAFLSTLGSIYIISIVNAFAHQVVVKDGKEGRPPSGNDEGSNTV